ncbi:T-box transcription factor TBX15-like isoform X5 [Tachypleus tridentatus]|uniref:T-box transcription factor TBX15-like isoform X5 n=1 Tax=Tachypleus tridentatus TaxID=6853 RepID=UPI003FCF77FC
MTLKRPTESTASLLSTKARAFSVDALLGPSPPKKVQHNRLDNIRSSSPNLLICMFDDNLPVRHQIATGNSCKTKISEADEDCHQPFSPKENNLLISREHSMSLLSSNETQDVGRNKQGAEADIQVKLCQKELWNQFHSLGNEMIITKAGRRMFPALKVNVTGLDPDGYYLIWVEIASVDNNRYRYVYPSSQWMIAGAGDVPLPTNRYLHPDIPAKGHHLMAQIVNFDKLKLTNSKQSTEKGQIALHSMHKYQPLIYIQKVETPFTVPDQAVDTKLAFQFSFPETVFITVTAYQNQEITKLKIASNPFAKGFRDPVKNSEGCDEIARRHMGNLTSFSKSVVTTEGNIIIYFRLRCDSDSSQTVFTSSKCF